jgi:RHS repeat-associated protein
MAFPQNATDLTFQRGIQPNGAYSISATDSVNMVSGNLYLSIPLAQLPPNQAGTRFPLTLVYNSQLLDATSYYDSWTDGSGQQGTYLTTKLVGSPNGGWQYTYGYALRAESRPFPSSTVDCGSAQEEFKFKLSVVFPDGSAHLLYPYNPPNPNPLSDGYMQMSYNGTHVGLDQSANSCSNFNIQIANPVFFTEDGTYARVEMTNVPAVAAQAQALAFGNASWKLYLKDGTVVTGTGQLPSTIQDPNHNSITITQTQDAASNVTTVMQDDFGRSITLMQGVGYNQDTVTQTGFNGAQLVTTINKTSITIQPYSYPCAQSASTTFTCSDGPTAFPVLSSILVPAMSASGSQTHLQYSFTYDTGGWNQSNGTCTSPSVYGYCGYGGLSIIYYPDGGAHVVYGYQDMLKSMSEPLTINPVASKVLHFDEQQIDGTTTADVQEYTSYQINTDGSGGSMTAADGGTTSVSAYSGAADWRRGLVYKTVYPDGDVEQKLWQRNTPFGGVTSLQDPNNPYVKAQYYSLGDTNKNPQETKLTVSTVDKNGNTVESDEYDWMPFANVPASLAIPTTSVTELRVSSQTAVNNAGKETSDGTEAIGDVNAAYWHPGAPMIGLIATRKVTSPGGTIAARTDYTYDANGNRTAEARWDSSLAATPPAALDSTSASVSRWIYASDGRLTDGYDPNNNHTVWTYTTSHALAAGGTGYLYPDERDDASGSTIVRKTGLVFDFSSGLLTQQKDLDNNVVTNYGYNDLGRQTRIDEAGLRLTTVKYDDANRIVTQTSDLRSYNDQAFVTITRYDGLGRPWLQQQNDDTGSAPSAVADGIKVRTLYRTNSSGSWMAQSNPYRNSSDNTETTLGWTVTQQDAMHRPLGTSHYSGGGFPVPWGSNQPSTGTATVSYSLDTTTSSDEAQIQRISAKDALGRVKSVKEAGAYVTSYGYDLLDNLSNVTQIPDPVNAPTTVQTRTFVYSSLSRLISAQNPETGPIATQYTYYPTGDLWTRTTPLGTVTMTYDALRRPMGKTYSAAAGVTAPSAVNYTYFTDKNTPYAYGRLKSTANANWTSNISSYDALGRVTGSGEGPVATAAYLFGYTWYANGTLNTETYPSTTAITNTLTGAGRISQVAQGTTNFASSVAYAPQGAISTALLGNLVKEQWTYNSRQQTTGVTQTNMNPQSALNGQSILNLGWAYSTSNNNGNVQSATLGGYAQSFGYDNVNRLQSVSETQNGSQTWQQHYTYDAVGNRWVDSSNVPLNGMTPTLRSWYDPLTNRFAGESYDGAGNLRGSAPFLNSFDVENQLILSDGGTLGSVTYQYDGSGRRIQVTSTVPATAGTTTYVYDALGQVAAEYGTRLSGTGIEYLGIDSLGSTRLVTDGSGTPTRCYDYMPFGEELGSNVGQRPSCFGSPTYPASGLDTASEKFTGKERDAETGLDYFGARYYSSAQGRFSSPDKPIIDQDVADPQSWNLYGYVRNNPLRYRDPTGRECVNLDNGTQGDDGGGKVCPGAKIGTSDVMHVVGNADNSTTAYDDLGHRMHIPYNPAIQSRPDELLIGMSLFRGIGGVASGIFGGIRAGLAARILAGRVLTGFTEGQTAMIQRSLSALEAAGYNTGKLRALIWADMPSGYAAMSLEDGAALGREAFSSQAMLNHTLEEELIHVNQAAQGLRTQYGPGTAQALEEAADAVRKFPAPQQWR